MNNVTQQVAANAEEWASASEQLTAQAEQMKGVIMDLQAVVGGRRANGNSPDARHFLQTGIARIQGTRKPAPQEKQLPAYHEKSQGVKPE